MPNQIRVIFTTILLLSGVPISAIAGPCDAYFTFDDTLADASGNGADGTMISVDGTPATASFVEGHAGRALQLDGKSAMRALLDLHPESCPQLTITAWIKAARDATQGRIISSEGQEGPGLSFHPTALTMIGPSGGVSEPDVLFPETWTFVALVYDHENDEQRLHWGRGSRPSTKPIGEMQFFPGQALWVGAYGPAVTYTPHGITIDELRIVGRALDTNQVVELANSAGSNAETMMTSVSAIEDGSAPVPACQVSSECPDANYCGVDNACHPNSQLPKDYAAASTGDPGRPGLDTTSQIPGYLIPDLDGDTASDSGGSSPRPGLGDTNPNPTPGGDMITDLSAGQVMAGRWVYVVDVLPGISGGNVHHTTLKFFGRDNGLSGTVSTHSGEISDEPLTSVSKIGRTISLSSASYGSWSGQVSENGGTMSLHSTDPDIPSRSFVKYSDSAEPETSPPANSSADPEPEPEPVYAVAYDASVLRYSGVSGMTGDYTERVMFTETQGLLYGLNLEDENDKPCRILIDDARPARGYSKPIYGFDVRSKIDVCDEGLFRLKSPVPVPGTLFGGADLVEENFRPVTGIQVCTLFNNRRVKGVRAEVRNVRYPEATHGASYSTKELTNEGANCTSWQPMVRCPANTFAVGVTLQLMDGSVLSPKDFLSGIALQCTEVEWKRVE